MNENFPHLPLESFPALKRKRRPRRLATGVTDRVFLNEYQVDSGAPVAFLRLTFVNGFETVRAMEAVQGTLFPIVEQHAPRRSWLRDFMEAHELHGPLVFRSHVALVLDVSRSRVQQLIDAGRIATVQIRGREYVPVAALEAFWADERKNGRPADSEARQRLLGRLTGR